MQFPESCVPHTKDVLGGGDEVQSLVLPIEDVDYGEPSVFVFGSKLELLAVVSRVGA